MGTNKMYLYNTRYAIIRFILAGLVLIIFTATNAGADSKADELQRKIADIGLLKQQLADRRQQAETMLSELLTQQKTLVSEVRLLHKSYEFKTYQQAQKFHRAHYNIELLRMITAYIDAFTKKIHFYQSGQHKLTYLSQLAEDDIRMISTLNDFEIDALTTQISLVINKYLREAHMIQIDPEKIDLVSPEEIWKGIVQGGL
jgi:hypothetical protein